MAVYDYEQTDHLLRTAPKPGHEECERAPFPGTRVGSLAAFLLWQHRHATEHHNQRGFGPGQRAFVDEFARYFELDLDDETVRGTVIKLVTGGFLVSSDDEPDPATYWEELATAFINILQGLALMAAEAEMGERPDG